MSELSAPIVAWLLLWGTLVGLDLVSVPQAMISRPLVAGTVAGWLLGDVHTGLRIGALFELFALDVLPVGAVRYPDYGPATIAAVALAAGSPWQLGLGLSTAMGLVLALLGGWSLQLVRRLNARAIQRRAAALAAGESGAIRRLQYGGLLRDAARGFLLTLAGLAVAMLLKQHVRLDEQTNLALTLVGVGSALAAAANGALT
ncbi:MAG: phosphotransferase system sorbose-specific subunit [Geminicoccaceae bacterium]|nr:phosphotransferase system sorbose-specific subunit [Geminicoccaceae bacterium]